MIENIKKLVSVSKTLKVLYVEDDVEVRTTTLLMLRNLFDFITVAVDGADGLEKFRSDKFDLIISDINMPNMNGIEMLKNIRNENLEISFIILSAHDEVDYFIDTIKYGVDGYILKPIERQQLVFNLGKVLEKIKLKNENLIYKQRLESINNNLENQVNERIMEITSLNKEIKDTQKEVIFTMGAIGESRSKETGNHVKRVALYSKIFALRYGLSNEEAEMLQLASPMHDIGKVAISDAILNKPDVLTPQEYEEMKKHAQLGYNLLKYSTRPLLKLAATIAYQHHEKFDGTGYPRGLKGEEIDIYGRITAIADVFDALANDRVYKKAWDDEKIFSLFKDERGKHFEPKLVDIFFDNQDEFLRIRDEYKD